ncbi:MULTISPECIES: sugar ABC transporter substrate-binding protein [Kitasatospora]|uniref:Putative sugar ABC transporter substrate-binding protein n=1 Tax=Kitasatospora setae (strain ATCC 33774 / DSM 43861 / JCM 3304 / KCC A-0304 / NBRC 14216 / KM-6054) TaxID=452652 RepID=E4N7L0_KITSK|nr:MULTISPECIES: sugar ABC transporter substrate-binding protein [Kitasatospora]BAJ27191.1 putative sugar ABC transporter substrate-binding protein [Kitasatospora setae KM-6054]
MPRSRLLPLVALAATATLLTAAGCARPDHGTAPAKAAAGNDAAANPAVAAAKQFTAAYTSTTAAWTGPTSSPPVAPGKTIVFLNRWTFSETNSYVVETAKQAAAALGWKFVAVDVSKDFNAGVTQALQLKPDGLISQVTEADADSQALAQIAASGIPHIDFTIGTTDLNTKNPGITHIVDYHYYLQGQLAAAEAVLATGGQARLGLFRASPNSSNQQEIQGIKDYFAQHGGGSVTAEQQIADGLIGSPQLGQAAVAFVQGHPDVNVVWDEFDGIAIGAVPAVRAAGLASKAPQISHEGDAPNLDFIRNGQGQIGDVAVSYGWATWAAFDDLNRIFNKVPLPQDDGVPVRLLTADNLPPAGQRYEGGYDYAGHYRTLWGVK